MIAVRAHLIITGRVQGVYFREGTRKAAQAAGVTGWVRNRDDGRVEAILEGDEVAVQVLIAWCHGGPPSARVEHVSVTWETPAAEITGFTVLPTLRGT